MVKLSRVSRSPKASWSHWLWCATEALVVQDETAPQPSNILLPVSISDGIIPLDIDFDNSKRSGTLKRCATGSLMRDSLSSFVSTSTMSLYRRSSEPWSNVQQTDDIYKVHSLFLSSARPFPIPYEQLEHCSKVQQRSNSHSHSSPTNFLKTSTRTFTLCSWGHTYCTRLPENIGDVQRSFSGKLSILVPCLRTKPVTFLDCSPEWGWDETKAICDYLILFLIR